MVSFCNWLNKRLSDLRIESEFNFYFEGVNLKRIEDSYYLTNNNKGIELVLSIDEIITSIHFFSSKEKDSTGFSGILPMGLNFSNSRLAVQSRLGEPNKSGGGGNDLFLGYVHTWDKYFFHEYSLHLEYTKSNDAIRILTIGSLELESYFNIELQ